MSEQRWLNERARSQQMMWQLRRTSVPRTKVGRRKLRLFACGCCRLIWAHIHEPSLRSAVEVAERFADGGATSAELQAAFPASGRKPLTFLEDHPDAQGDTVIAMVQSTTEAKPYSAAFNMTAYPLPLAGHRGASAEGEAIICDLLRDVFGNPFREVKFDKRWKTDTAVSLAKQMYESREFGTMPILADALQDAGCDSDDILSHCRDAKQVHVRGCWVVDLVLGKS